ncbi:MAG: DUF1624 domain-containing protein [Candidatus Lokiarchaeota archaeon]|nr:DUF1624 domain-containing protein [Candidatus Lokiarchaeota archaeon]MBD3200653.1 DUF1624 domain-containing protein [Candidatus Lokiarchaeota archaeon]
MTKRLSSIDTFRGICMVWMLFGHTTRWWLIPQNFAMIGVLFPYIDAIGASAFLFISGVSTIFSYKKKMKTNELSDNINEKRRSIRTTYILRSLIIFVIAFVYNLINAVSNPGFPMWIWFVLLTASVSLLFAWPLLKLSKWKRLSVVIIFIFIDQILILNLPRFQNNSKIAEILLFTFYSGLDTTIKTTPILTFFPFFLLGTVIGEMIFDLEHQNSISEEKKMNIKRFIRSSLIIGAILTLTGFIFSFPDVSVRGSFSWIIYSIGIEIIILSLFYAIEKLNIFNLGSKYNFLYYFSYYSLSLYLTNTAFSYLFSQELNYYNYMLFFLMSMSLLVVFMNIIHQRFKGKFSIKFVISLSSGILANYINQFIQEQKQRDIGIMMQKP